MALPPLTVTKPTLTNPQTLAIIDGYHTAFPTADAYIVPQVERTAGWKVTGNNTAGQDVIVKAAHTVLPDSGGTWSQANLYQHRGFYADKIAGVLYIAGQHVTGAGLSEGGQFNIPGELRIGHCRIDWCHAQDPVGYTDNHPDLIQVMRADLGVTLEWVCGVTDMQGLMVKYQTDIGAKPYHHYNARNCLLHGGDYGAQLLNVVDFTLTDGRPKEFTNVCIMPSKRKLAEYGHPVDAARHSILPYPTNAKQLLDGRWQFAVPVPGAKFGEQGVYYDPALAVLTPQQCMERWLPADQLGVHYTG